MKLHYFGHLFCTQDSKHSSSYQPTSSLVFSHSRKYKEFPIWNASWLTSDTGVIAVMNSWTTCRMGEVEAVYWRGKHYFFTSQVRILLDMNAKSVEVMGNLEISPNSSLVYNTSSKSKLEKQYSCFDVHLHLVSVTVTNKTIHQCCLSLTPSISSIQHSTGKSLPLAYHWHDNWGQAWGGSEQPHLTGDICAYRGMLAEVLD